MFEPSEKYGMLPEKEDPRDFVATNIFGYVPDVDTVQPDDEMEIIAPPAVFLLPRSGMPTKIENQSTTFHCTAYSVCKTHEIMNIDEHERHFDFDPELQWKNQKVYPGTANESWGDYNKSACQAIVKYGSDYEGRNYPCRGYAKTDKTKKAMMYWIWKGFPLHCGSRITRNTRGQTTLSFARDTGYARFNLGKDSGGHAFCIRGYDEEGVICENSYTALWGKLFEVKNDERYRGCFMVKWADVGYLDTPWILYDKVDAQFIFNDVTTASPWAETVKWGLTNGIVKGYPDGNFYPDKQVSRVECLQMIKNLYEKLKK